MGSKGYISLYRQILDNPIWNIKPYSKGQAWVTILLLTNHKVGYMPIKNGQLLKVERGECGYSDTALADIFGWSRAKVKRFLTLLETQKMVQLKNRFNRNIISILNYDTYQNNTVNSTVNSTVNEHLTLQQTNTNNNENNDNNENNINTTTTYNVKNKNFDNISDLNEDRIKDLKNFYGEYKNVHLNPVQLDALKALILNDKIVNQIINNLSENIETGKEKLYDEKTPAMHYIRLKKYWQYLQNKQEEKKQEIDEEYNFGIG